MMYRFHLLLVLVLIVLYETSAFSNVQPFNVRATINTSTAHFMGKKAKPSMSDRRKKRAQRRVSPDIETIRTIKNDADSDRVQEPPPVQTVEAEVVSEEKSEQADEIDQKAASLLQSQRKSVDSLTYIRKQIEESFPADAASEALMDKGYFVYDGFLTQSTNDEPNDDKYARFGDDLLHEMLGEGIEMLSNDKLERDITRLGEGEFLSLITGGDKYIDCPRLTEYVVCMTRHLPPLLNKLDTALSDAASMGSIRMYDRKTKLGTSELLSDNSDDDAAEQSFGVVCENDEDSRKVTAMLFISSKNWDSTCGGGITFETGESIDAVRDRLVLFRSDTCSYHLDAWIGKDKEGLQHAACVTVHFVRS